MSSCFCGPFGNDNSCLRVLYGLNIVSTPCCFNVRRNSSDSPLTYGMTMAVRLIGRWCCGHVLLNHVTVKSLPVHNSCFSCICEQASEKEPKARTLQLSISTVYKVVKLV